MKLASAKEVYCRVAIVCIAFLLNQSAYYGVEALQSSLNGAIGTYAVSALYIAAMMASSFLPTLVLAFMRKRYAMSIWILSYPVFTLANLYPRAYTLMPASILVGLGGSVVWTGSRVYISELADEYAKMNGEDRDKITSLLFGLFYGFISMSLLAGNCVSSAVMRAFHDKPKIQKYTSITLNTSFSQCGINNCIGNTSTGIFPHNTHKQANKATIDALLAGFVVIQLVSSAILLFGMIDDIPRPDNSDETSLISPLAKKTSEIEPLLQKAIKQVTATVRLHIFNLSAKLVIPFVVECGLLQGFTLSQFTRDWITCYIGIEDVGYAVGAYGLGSMIGSIGTGVLSKITSRWVITLIDLLMEVAIWISLLLWEPKKTEDVWILFLTTGLLGVVHTSRKGLIATIYSLYFHSDKEAALPSFGIWDSLGKAIAFAISTNICNWTYIILLISLTTVGTIFYLVTEIMHARRKAKK